MPNIIVVLYRLHAFTHPLAYLGMPICNYALDVKVLLAL